jgi:hypothetical protein
MIGHFWTPAEDAILREHFPATGSRAVAELTGKSRGAVRLRAQRLHVETRPRWTDQQDSVLRDMWGVCPIRDILVAVPHTTAAIHRRASRLGIGQGCPVGYEYVQVAARRSGFGAAHLRRILKWAGVTVHRAMVRHPDDVRCPRHYVDPRLVDNAVADWLQTETPAVAAKRYGLGERRLRVWLREAAAAGVEMPRDPARGRCRWWIPSATIDAVVAARGWRPVRAEKIRRVA